MNKYNNKKTYIDGMMFDSVGEASRYKELKLLESQGSIKDLKCQVDFPLLPKQKGSRRTERAVNYIADFVYVDNGKMIVEDYKGMRTREYILKRKMMRFFYNIEIYETPEKNKGKRKKK